MTLNRLVVILCLILIAGYANAAVSTPRNDVPCAKPLSEWQLLDALKTEIKNNDPNGFACLFNIGVAVGFNKTNWLVRKKQFSGIYPELMRSGFGEFLESAAQENTTNDRQNNLLIIRKRMAIKYGGSPRLGYKVLEIDDLKEPNDFKYSNIHSEREFHAWYLRFQQAIELKDKVAVAKMACYPLGIATFDVDYNQRNFTVHNERQFVQRYDEIITTHTRQVVLDSHWPNLFNNSDGISLGQGDIWIVSTGSSECIASVTNGPGIEKLDAQAKAAKAEQHKSTSPTS